MQPLQYDAAAYVFRHTGSARGVQWAILALQDSPDFAAQARHVSEHFEIQAADDAQVELDIQREVWRAEQAPRWFAAAERRRAAARAARAFAAQSRRSRAPRQSGRRADPPRAPALGAASPATDAEVDASVETVQQYDANLNDARSANGNTFRTNVRGLNADDEEMFAAAERHSSEQSSDFLAKAGRGFAAAAEQV